jgi:type I restriction enzyme, S subunit
MTPYPAYKPSGIEWLGDIPEHWVKLKFRWVFRVSSGDFLTKEIESHDGFPVYGGNGQKGFLKEDKNEGKKLLLGRGGGKCGNVHLVDGKYWVSEHALRVKPKVEFDFEYFKYFLEFYDFNRFAIQTAQPLINSESVLDKYSLFPPINEQNEIAEFLKYKSHLIDTLISKKQQLIERLKEYRTAIINQAVTKGLDPNVKMKDSGIEWLGEVPEHWKKNKLSRIAEIKGRIGWRGYTVGDLRDQEDGVLVIGATQIDNNGNINLTKSTYLSLEKYEESPEIKLKGKEILLVKVGATIGKVGYVPENFQEATINPNVMLIRKPSIQAKFLFYYLRTLPVQISMNVIKSAGAQDAIKQEFVNSIWVPYPEIHEQSDIVKYIENKTNLIDTQIEKEQKFIEYLKEYRTALISEVVTGKVNVCN